ncbi:DUF222 domain-containing protein [Microbispora sp. RL4-1S]|uniref:DUF222 domain-containing protein n=1 Tax=Microbispora oryzae TaxID=2806554 RepID=A0A940WJF9_9ACTN|nr:HNH endonuclease signature motif containing protein [Microbispora oryzae]MBP2702291.1 DUF222 domain-containing protein [Microbispora oryzae]
MWPGDVAPGGEDPGDAGSDSGAGEPTDPGLTSDTAPDPGPCLSETELLGLAARWAAAEVPDSSAMCLQRAETLIQAVDLLNSAMVAVLHRAHVTGEAKAFGHASTASWLRSDRPSTPGLNTPGLNTPGLNTPGLSTPPRDTTAPLATASGSAEPGAGSSEAQGGPGVPVVVRRGPGMTGAQASRWLRISGEVARLPEVKARYRDGSLSGGAVDAITTVTAKLTDTQVTEAEPILVELADSASCAEVAKAGRYIREILDPGTLVEECEDDYASRFLLLRPSSTGGVEGEFRLPREAAARLREFMAAYARPKARDDDRPLRVRQADAFAALLSEKVSTELLVMVRVESLPDDILARTGTQETSPAGTDPDPDPDRMTGAQSSASTGSTDGGKGGVGGSRSASVARVPGGAGAPPTAGAPTVGAGRDRPNDDAHPDDADPDDADPDDADPDDAKPDGAGSGHAAGSGGDAARADACRTCGHAPDRLAPGLLVATGHLLPVSDVHRLARTSRLTRLVMDAKGQVLDMGRSVRLATPAQRKALLAQYATCYCQGCPIPADMAEVDHVYGWIDDGVTNLDVLAPACTFHNRDKFTHPDRYTARRNPDGTWTLLYNPKERLTRRPPTQPSHPPPTQPPPG